MKKNKTVKFTGILATPIIWRRTPSKKRFRRVLPDNKENIAEVEARMLALFEHYGIEPSQEAYGPLVFALAKDFVPGFEVLHRAPSGPGRQSIWTAEKRNKLIRDVSTLRKNKNSTARAACNFLCNHKGDYHGINPDTLYRSYKESIRKEKESTRLKEEFREAIEAVPLEWPPSPTELTGAAMRERAREQLRQSSNKLPGK